MKELAVPLHHLTLPFSPGNYFYQKTTCLSSPTHPTFLFSRFKTKLKGSNFDSTEVIEEELQAALSTLTEHNFQDVFIKWQKCWEQCLCAEGDCFNGDGGQ
jgi:hypothetical protein